MRLRDPDERRPSRRWRVPGSVVTLLIRRALPSGISHCTREGLYCHGTSGVVPGCRRSRGIRLFLLEEGVGRGWGSLWRCGGGADERRLFYAALTRARDWVSISRHDKVTTRSARPVHHILCTVAEHTQATGTVPTPAEIDGLLDRSFFLPTVNKPAHRQLKDAARRLVTEYTCDHANDLYRCWRPSGPSSCTSTA
jgi:hypothetical protein